jgi:cell wall-associated NlpC family hydrolase
MEGEELYSLQRKGYRLNAEQAARIDSRLLTLLGVPSELMTGLIRGKGVDRAAWVLSQVGATWMRADVARCLPPLSGEWRPSAAFFQSSSDLDGVLAFLKAHLPDGDVTARQQGLKRPLSLSEWEGWSKAETALRAGSQSGADLLYASRTGLFTPSPIADGGPENTIAPPTPEAISALEQLRRKPVRPTRGVYLAATARKYVGLPYVWGGESPTNGFDCSGLVQYVCRTWGISLPRTAAEQYRVGRPVSFMDLEPGDLVFLANTYKPGVSHVGMYIGDGQWVQAAGTSIGIVIGDVPYFDAGSGPGARRLNLARLPRVAGEPSPSRVPNRAAVVASRHSTQSRQSAGAGLARRASPSRQSAATGGLGPIVAVRICGDTGGIANSGCDTYKLVRMPRSQVKSMRRCRKHKPLGGERW